MQKYITAHSILTWQFANSDFQELYTANIKWRKQARKETYMSISCI